MVNRVTVAITTRDRWEDLEYSVGQWRAQGLDSLPFIVVDDGSAQPLAPAACRALPNCRIVADGASKGLIVRRNEMAALATTDYLLSLDDDSFLLPGSRLDRAVEYLDRNPDVDVLGFTIHEGPREAARKWDGNAAGSPREAKSYIGCGHLLRVKSFLAQGGYKGYFFQMTEERDYSMRVYRNGRKVVHFPQVGVLHVRTLRSRSNQRIAYYGARNTMLMWLLNVPFPACAGRVVRSCPGLIYAALKERLPMGATLAGMLAGVVRSLTVMNERRPMTRGQYASWKRLPQTGY